MEDKKCLTKAQILDTEDLEREYVEVPEWNGGVYVRMLKGVERDRFEESNLEWEGEKAKMSFKNIRAKLCALTMVDEKGNRIFKTKDIETLGQKSGKALDRIYKVAQRLNGLSLKAEDEAVKNSESGQGDLIGLSLPQDLE